MPSTQENIEKRKIINSEIIVTLVQAIVWVGLYYYFLFYDTSYERDQCGTLISWSYILMMYFTITIIFFVTYIILMKLNTQNVQDQQEQHRQASQQENLLSRILYALSVAYKMLSIIFEIVIVTIIGIVLLASPDCYNLYLVNVAFFCIQLFIILFFVLYMVSIIVQKGPKQAVLAFANYEEINEEWEQFNQQQPATSRQQSQQYSRIDEVNPADEESQVAPNDSNDPTQPLNGGDKKEKNT